MTKLSRRIAKAALPVTSLVLLAVFIVFAASWSARIPLDRLLACLTYAAVFCIGMEYVARYEHKFLWHSKALWFIHASHHRRRSTMGQGPTRHDEKVKVDTSAWENNDIFPVVFASTAMLIMLWAVLPPTTLLKDCLLGASGGISLYGTSYFIGHDLCAHERGGRNLANFLRNLSTTMVKCADIHNQFHHNVSTTATDNEDPFGPPYGFWLGPSEVEYAARARKSGKDVLLPMPLWTKAMFWSALGFLGVAAFSQ